MVKRKIVKIDEEKCNGCRLCIPNCKEGALQIIDGKARLISDLFCDGLGACIGHCPEDAIEIIEREAEPYDERKVMEKIVKQGKNTVKAHLEHLKEHGEDRYLQEAIDYLNENDIEINMEENKMKKNLPCGCPGTMIKDFSDKKEDSDSEDVENKSELRQWPIQLNLLPPNASFFNNSDLLIAADCVGFANPNLHSRLIKGRSVAIGCPKLDDLENYKEKIKGIIEMNDLNSITIAIMEVPCCTGLYNVVEKALDESGKKITLKKVVVKIGGEERN
ncbi:4Fe-4S binding protein [Candidatus Woesearchaeota archaeon]|nr:4Fe-4S binding protein [Candidatus Woesearchaeota archaeon]